MGHFKDMHISFLNREGEALNKLYKIKGRNAEKYYMTVPYIFRSDSPDRLLDCIYYWLALKGHMVWHEKYPLRVVWTHRDQRTVIGINEDKVFCGDAEVTSFAEFLEFYDGIKKQKKRSN